MKKSFILFSKDGKQCGAEEIPDWMPEPLRWARKSQEKTPELQGLGILIDWEKREILPL